MKTETTEIICVYQFLLTNNNNNNNNNNKIALIPLGPLCSDEKPAEYKQEAAKALTSCADTLDKCKSESPDPL